MTIIQNKYFIFLHIGLFLGVLVQCSTSADLKSGELPGKKLLSFPTLVSILKARNNATRPILSSTTGLQVIGGQPLIDAVKSSTISPPNKHRNICSPISQEKDRQIARLCNERRRHHHKEMQDGEATPSNRCMESFCVTIIPETDESDDDIESVFGKDIVAYTDCEVVKNLFRILVKAAITPKCYDCSN